MTEVFLLAAFLLGYFLGSIPFGMVLTKLAGVYEGTGTDAWGLGRLPPGNAAEQTKAIVAFRVPISRIETKLKLSQNRDLEDRKRVIARLEASDSQDSKATAQWMERVLP